MEAITSSGNEKIKLVKSLLSKKGRAKHGLFIAEGGNLVKDIPAGYPVEFILLKKSTADKFADMAKSLNRNIYLVEDNIFKTISDTVTPFGVMAVCKQKEPKAIESSKILALDNIQDPGNMGTILRSCLAFGFYDIIGISCADIYSPKVVRASMSAIFKLNYIAVDMAAALEILADYDLAILDAKGADIRSCAFGKKVALVLGNESIGVSQVLKSKGRAVSIPISNAIESLNAGVAASIAMFELKQKEGNNGGA